MRFIDPKTDFAFKRIFGSEEFTVALSSFINAALGLKGERLEERVETEEPERHRATGVRWTPKSHRWDFWPNPYQARDLPVAKGSIVDVACTAKSGNTGGEGMGSPINIPVWWGIIPLRIPQS